MNTKRFVPILACAAALLAGCGRETTSPDDASQAPGLPPGESMQIDLSYFSSEEGLPIASPGPGAQAALQGTRFNWSTAALTVFVINTTVGTVLTPPHLAFQAAIHTFPSLQPDGSYLWIYTFAGPVDDVQVRLRGRVEGDHVAWELRVTHPGEGWDNVVWYHGETRLDNEAGFWVFNDLEALGYPEVARIDWEVGAEDDRRLVMSVTGDGHADEGDTLTYDIDGTSASVELWDASEGHEVEIVWDMVTGAGRITAPAYNDGAPACWDENRDDTVCPGTTI